MALEAVAKRRNSGGSSPVQSGSGIFPRRPSGSKSRTKPTKVPLFVPDEEDNTIPQAAGESEGDEWEDFDGELEDDVQMSIAIAESLESQHHSRRISDPRPSAHTPVLETPIKPPRQINKAGSDDEDEFTSPSRLATQLSIAGARKPLSARIPSDSVRGTGMFVPSISPKKSSQNIVANPTPDRPPAILGEGDADDKGESDEDDDMEEVSIPQAMENRPRTPVTKPILGLPKPLVNSELAPTTDLVGIPLAIEVEDVVAKRFEEFQKIFAKKRKAFRAENPQVQEQTGVTREAFRAESPGLEYADAEVVEVQEVGEEPMEVRPSPHPQSDEDEDMEEVEVVPAPRSVPSRVPQSSVQSEPAPDLQPAPTPTPAVAEVSDAGGEEDAPISDWSRSPSPRARPPGGEAGPSTSTSGMALDRSRGLLDPDDSFDQGPPGEQDQEQEAFDAAHEMDLDAEAGEFARWMSQVKGRDLDDVRKEIEQEISGLRKEQKAAMRDSEDITGQMIAQIMVSPSRPSHKLIILDLDLILPP